MWFLRMDNCSNFLGRDQDTTKDILDQLERQGYVRRADEYEKIRKGKGKEVSAEPLYTLVADDQVLLSNIFRPELNIPHKVSPTLWLF